ncbi:MAG: SpoIVB peptidase [Ruminococcaceae bacterium]|nr:SpoIVB peptidase [Oscillospiraceae bacterium]
MQNAKLKIAFRIIFVMMLIGIAILGVLDYIIPESISVFSDSTGSVNLQQINLPFISTSIESVPVNSRVSQGDSSNPFYVSLSANTKMFGILPLKKVNVDMFTDITLYPGGMPFGVKLYTDGVIVVGISGVETDSGKKTPATDSGLKIGDIIVSINGKAVNTTDEVSSAFEQSGGNKLELTVKRDGKEIPIYISPVFSKADNMYKAGIWIRDSTAGIGTVTFISPKNNSFAGLGHGICDVDTGDIMPLRKGTVVDVTINGINKGVAGNPGELKGTFIPGKIGSLIGNITCGVYGMLSEKLDTSHSEPLKIGLKDELKTGKAEIYCTVNDKLDKYSIEIIKIGNKNDEQKNFVIKITDKRLLDTTGGIVQGMSGSPIIQNGKLVGAVTHVLVNDPTKGYGIFIENMLKNMPELFE